MAIDAVVIGSGPNGLAAAIRLAEAGLEVRVLELADAPGGAVRTEALTLPGFRHDTFSSVYPAAVASPVFERMPLDRHGLDWVHPRACMAHPLPDGTAVGLYRDLAETAGSLDEQHRGDGDRWIRFASPFLESFDAVRQTMLGGFPPVGGSLRLVREAGVRTAAEFGRLLTGTAAGLGRRLFEGQGARAWLYGAAMHGDTPPDKSGSAIAAFYLNLLGNAVGWPSPRGGAQRLTEALVAHLESLGGQVETGTRAERVLVDGGHASGVGVAGGNELATRIVIADVMPAALVQMTSERLAAWYRAGIRLYKHGPATVKVDWALDGPIPWLSQTAREAGTVHVGGNEAAMLDSIKASAERLPHRPFLLLGQQSLADPTRAPDGRHTAWAYTHAPPRLASTLGDEHDIDVIESQVERFAPGFRDRILARHVLTPNDLEARDPNLVGGDVGGGSYRLRQAVFRPLPVLSPYRTPLPGLYLGSSAAFPGGAVHGVPGDAAARAALVDLRRRDDRVRL
jgi:phytoene dehydrogenase-like protein